MKKSFKFSLKLLTYTLLAVIIISCNDSYEKLKKLPSEINKKIIVSPKCDLIIYSSNKNNYFEPYTLSGFFTSKRKKTKHISNLKKGYNYFVQSISCDCETISILGQEDQTQKFHVFLYNIKNGNFQIIPSEEELENNTPVFSPTKNKLAFLSGPLLKLYDYNRGSYEIVNQPKSVYFRYLSWSRKGNFLFLEDYETNIWRMDIASKNLVLVYKTKKRFTGSRLISPSNDNEETIYFLSDNNSNFNQIYKLDARNNVSLCINSQEDKLLLQRPIDSNQIFFKAIKNGSYLVKVKTRNKVTSRFPFQGVIYDFVDLGNQSSIVLFADAHNPASIFHINDNSSLKDLLGTPRIKSLFDPILIKNKQGMYNLVYSPKNKPKSWVIWFHGGPFEQMSNRYNPYINSLLEHDYGVVVLNYPGSIGIGNEYELINRSEENMLNYQLVTVREDINQIKRLYGIQQKYALIGISYGTKVANHYAAKYGSEISRLIDFSGIAFENEANNIPTLFIYGKEDFILQHPQRVNMIQSKLKQASVSRLIVKDEGHVINQKQNIYAIIDQILDFLP